MGLGLSGVRRIMDGMDVESHPGKGTTVTVRKWLDR
jgi:anti-sigma regulatory factor (Ser/Thr protein kinase)